MTSDVELDRFLGELSTRRERILTLADRTGAPPADLVDELRELGQQLVVADEELRVQQEELESTRGELASLSAERDLLLRHSTRAYVVTDARGVVLHATRAAQQLVRHPQARVVPRPIASWFEVSDRRRVRDLVGRSTSAAGPGRAAGLHLIRPGGDPVPVDVVVEPVTGPREQPALLRWELLTAAAEHQPDPAGPRRAAGSDDALALRVADAAVELHTCRTRDELVALARTIALALVPGARDARVVREDAGVLDDGSVLEDGRAREDDGTHTDRAAAARAGGAISVPLVVADRRLGRLTVEVHDTGQDLGHESDPEVAVSVLGTQVALGLHRLGEVEDLRTATGARQLVSQAVGILAGRRGVSPDAAFALLVKESQDRNVKLRSLAQSLVDTVQTPPPARP